jgi:hypothetical protein
MKTFRKFVFTAAAATTLVASGILIGGRVEAAPIGAPDGVRAAIDGLNLAENAQFILSGRRYCWYEDAWQGPGWYRCGYAWRQGFGWGGGEGWQGWSRERHGGRDMERRHDGERDFDRTRRGERNLDRGPRNSERTGNSTRMGIGAREAPSGGGQGPGHAATEQGAGPASGGAAGEHHGGGGNDRR